MIVQISVIQGSDLVAKDRNMFGKKTSSDPYVSVILCSYPPAASNKNNTSVPINNNNHRHQQQLNLGRTTTVKKNLSPTWNYSVATSVPYNRKNCLNKLSFRIFDEDKLSSDDSMGVVEIPLAFQDSRGAAVWHEIPKNSAKKASGKLQISIQTSLHRVQGLSPYC